MRWRRRLLVICPPTRSSGSPILTPAVLLHLLSTALAEDSPSATISVEATAAPDGAAGSVTSVPLGPETPPGEDLAAAVDTAAGTTVRRFGGIGEFAGVSLRGSTFRQVEVTLDGVPLNPDGSHAVDLSALPVTAFGRVDVYRGFAPASFGSSAIGGVLDLVTAERPVPAAIGAAGGSWGTNHAWGQLAGGWRSLDVLATVDHLHTDGDFPYLDDQGTDFNRLDDRTVIREHAALDRFHGLARVRLGPPDARFTLLDAANLDDQDLPGTISSPAERATWQGAENLVSAALTARLGDRLTLTPRGWWSYRRGTFEDPDGEVGIGSAWTTDTWNTAGAEVKAGWVPVRPTPALTMVVTGLVRGREEVYTPLDRLIGEGDGDRRRTALTGSAGADILLAQERIVLSPVLQAEVLDNRALGTIPYQAVPVAPNGQDLGIYALPRGSVRVRPVRQLALHANAGAYLRAPDFTELFGSTGGVVGNTDLVPEHGTSAEVGAHLDLLTKGSAPLLPFGATVDAALVRSHAFDLIVYEPNSQQTERAVNVGEGTLQTVELGVQLCLGDVLDTSSSLTWTRARNASDDPTYAEKALPNVPPWELSHTTSAHLTAPFGGRFALSHTWTFTAATYADAANVNLQAPRDLHSLALSLTPLPGGLSLVGEVLNLLDVRGEAVPRNPYDPSDGAMVVRPLTDFAGYPLPGRTVMIGVTWQDHPRTDP